MLLANLTKSSSLERLIPLTRSEVPNLPIKATRAITQLIELYNLSTTWNKQADFDHLAYVFADLAKVLSSSSSSPTTTQNFLSPTWLLLTIKSVPLLPHLPHHTPLILLLPILFNPGPPILLPPTHNPYIPNPTHRHRPPPPQHLPRPPRPSLPPPTSPLDPSTHPPLPLQQQPRKYKRGGNGHVTGRVPVPTPHASRGAG